MAFDVIVVGGGVAGAAFAFAASRAGRRVLILEREERFRDRVRGESMHPWGVAEAGRLELEAILRGGCATPAKYFDTYVGGALAGRRNLQATSLARRPCLNAHHPELQQALLDAAAAAGSKVSRGVRAISIEASSPALVRVAQDGSEQTLSAPLLVIADGPRSRLCRELGMAAHSEAVAMQITGVLLAGVTCPPDRNSAFFPAAYGRAVLWFPLSEHRARLYFVDVSNVSRQRDSGARELRPLLDTCVELGLPESWIHEARPAGPCATFAIRYSWLESPVNNTVAVIGDAAGDLDPIFGCGLSLALRDARVLSEKLAGSLVQALALDAYASARAVYYASLKQVEGWTRRILYGVGVEADALRARAIPRCEPLGVDVIGSGPESRSDPETEAALFA